VPRLSSHRAHRYDVHPRPAQHCAKLWLTRRRKEKKEGKYLKELSELGHFLKGSSATLGLTKVKDSCEKIQHYGQLKDDSGIKDITEEKAQEKLATIIKQAKTEFTDVKEILKKFYQDEGEEEEEEEEEEEAAPAPAPAPAATAKAKA
jgi:HPt (histidine-containing phosphotransfer) domain-containing protein